MKRSADVVVIGAGVAGLVAADIIRSAGRSVVVLEARPDRVGGRLESVPAGGARFDLGGAWIGADHRRARALIGDLGLTLAPTHVGGAGVVAYGGRLWTEREYKLRYPHDELQLRLATRRLERLARDVSPDAPWAAPGAERLDGETLGSWLRRAVRGRRARATLERTMANIFGADATQVSLLHALVYLRANGGIGSLLGIVGGAQQDLVVGGAQSIPERLAERLGDALVLGAPARTVEHGEDGVRVEADGIAVDAAAAVVAVPPALAARVAFAPALAGTRDQLWQRMPMGDVIKLVAVYERAAWRDAGLTAESWGGDLPYSFSYDVGGPAGAPGAIAVFYIGERARAARELPAAARAEAVRDGLVRCLGEGAAEPAELLERDWAAEAWTRGAYSGFMTPGGWTSFGRALRSPVGPISFAGTETAVEGLGYVEGAIESAERAAAEVLARR
jgi:monoamine oxidase